MAKSRVSTEKEEVKKTSKKVESKSTAKTKKTSSTTKSTAKSTKSEKASAKSIASEKTAKISSAEKMEFEIECEKMSTLVQKQRDFFATGTTKSISFRKRQLTILYNTIKRHQNDILEALRLDLCKGKFEAFACEIGLTLSEISHVKRHLNKWSKPKSCHQPITTLLSSAKLYPEPYGVTLIMSPWNYPFLLTMEPLIASLAAGNCAIVKPSRYSKYTSEMLQRIIKDAFNKEYVSIVTGGHIQNQALLEQKFDYIFFTGSKTVGKIVMEKASKYLTPVTLELGGKSPVIIDKSANIKLAAKRLVWGKLINAGQTCIAPDYIMVHESLKKHLITALKEEITKQYTEEPLNNPDYPKIINQKHFERLKGLVPEAKCDPTTNKISPTVIDLGELGSKTAKSHPLMQEEIFGPFFPIMSYNDLNAVIKHVNSGDKPLALYLFANNKEVENKIIKNISYGGGCINDCIEHIISSNTPFGGVGESGMGCYHGKFGFDTFSHYKTVMKKSSIIELDMIYGPHKDEVGILKYFMK